MNTTAGVHQRPDNPRRVLYPAHAIVRDGESHMSYRCLCGERASGSPDAQRRILGRHVMENTRAA